MSVLQIFTDISTYELECDAYVCSFASYIGSILGSYGLGYGSTPLRKMYDVPPVLKFLMFFSLSDKKVNLWPIVIWIISVAFIVTLMILYFFDIHNCRFLYCFVVVSVFVLHIFMGIDLAFFEKD